MNMVINATHAYRLATHVINNPANVCMYVFPITFTHMDTGGLNVEYEMQIHLA